MMNDIRVEYKDYSNVILSYTCSVARALQIIADKQFSKGLNMRLVSALRSHPQVQCALAGSAIARERCTNMAHRLTWLSALSHAWLDGGWKSSASKLARSIKSALATNGAPLELNAQYAAGEHLLHTSGSALAKRVHCLYLDVVARVATSPLHANVDLDSMQVHIALALSARDMLLKQLYAKQQTLAPLLDDDEYIAPSTTPRATHATWRPSRPEHIFVLPNDKVARARFSAYARALAAYKQLAFQFLAPSASAPCASAPCTRKAYNNNKTHIDIDATPRTPKQCILQFPLTPTLSINTFSTYHIR
jgi:hypothetical protein